MKMRSCLNKDEYNTLLNGTVGDLVTFLDMYFTADWEETNAVLGKVEAQIHKAKGIWSHACSNPGYVFRVSDGHRVNVDRAIENLANEIGALRQGRVSVQKRWEGVFSRFCMSVYWFALERSVDAPSASAIVALFAHATRANGNQDNQGLRFLVEARRSAVAEFIDINSTKFVEAKFSAPLRKKGVFFLEDGDRKDEDLSNTIHEAVRKIAGEWEDLGRVPAPSEISPINDPDSIWLDESR